jgi:ribosomal protein S18 acetylase RimI-like enzyme
MNLSRRPRWKPQLPPQPFSVSDLRRIRFDLHPRLAIEESERVLLERPGASFWLPDSEEFILVEAWRHRTEMSAIHAFGAFANEDLLMQAVLDAARQAGQAAMVVVDLHETRSPSFLKRHGFHVAEEIVTYAHSDLQSVVEAEHSPRMTFERVAIEKAELLDAVLVVDHAAFPWFWWNSREEFLQYIGLPRVEVWAGRLDGRVVAYAGMTRYFGWAHLDRIATLPMVQGQGFGREMLLQMMHEAALRGAKSLALSTQRLNQQSRHLYARTGFLPTPRDDYSIHIASFDDALVLEGTLFP